METSRRTMLKAAVVIPAAALTAGAGTAAAAAADAAPTVLTPYKDYPWRWWAGYGDIFYECFETKEEAIEYAKGSEYPLVAECQAQDFSLKVDGDEILEMLYGRNEDAMNEDGEFLTVTPEQEKDLGRAVTAAIEAWAVRNKIDIRAWMFGGIRNEVRIEPPKRKHTA